MGPTAGQRRRSAGPISFRELAIGGIAIALENAAPTSQMPFEAFARPTVLEAVDDDRRPRPAIRPIIPQIGPQPALSGSSASGRQNRQCRLVGENPVAGADDLEKTICERLEVEADMAHPASHEIASEFDLVACKDRLLPIQRQAVGVFGDGDAGQKPLRRDAALDQAGGRRRLDDALATGLAGIPRAARHDHLELRRDDVEAFADVLANLHPSAGAARTGPLLGLNDLFDPLEMRRQRSPPAGLASWRRPHLLRFGLNCAETGLHFLEGKGVLALVELLGAAPIGRTLNGLQQKLQAIDPRLR